MWSITRRNIGRRGERRAAADLKRHGYRILARSYTCSLGEIDIIAEKDEFIVFVEVKTRSSSDLGEPWQAVNQRKRRQVTRAAVYYLKSQGITDRPIRFDIIAIIWPLGWFTRPAIQHIEDAFEAEGSWSV